MSADSFGSVQAELEAAPASPLPRLIIAFAWIKARIDDGIDAVGVETLVTQWNSLFDQYIGPIDLPINDMIERTLVDPMLRSACERAIRHLAKLVDDDATPTP